MLIVVQSKTLFRQAGSLSDFTFISAITSKFWNFILEKCIKNSIATINCNVQQNN